MKRIVLIAALTVASVQLRASHMASEFNLKTSGMEWFIVTLDDQVYDTPVTCFQVSELDPGTHHLTVTLVNQGHCSPDEYYTDLFSGYIRIPARSRVFAFIDRYGRFRINRIQHLPVQPVIDPSVCQPVVPVPYCTVMNNQEFNQLVYSLNGLSFESSRMQVARQALTSNNVTALQVFELLRLMTFESSKLELAKFAYRNTVDKQHYYLVNEAFSFESSITDLNNYIFSI